MNNRASLSEMNAENNFNLVDEPWIPVLDHGRVSLRDVFTGQKIRGLSGNPVQKMSLTKLLLAIAQAAATPEDQEEWRALGRQGLTKKCAEYLDKWRERFFLYGENPFLQMPEMIKAKCEPYGVGFPEAAIGNKTVLNDGQLTRSLDDADKALVLVRLMSFALGGKKTDASIVLSPEYEKKKSGSPGPAVSARGLLHSLVLGRDLIGTLWLNLFDSQTIVGMKIFQGGVGQPPWEKMPDGEDCPIASKLRQTLMGRLVPMNRFCLLADTKIHYSEGIRYQSHKEGIADPTAALQNPSDPKKVKAKWTNPEKRPWRELTGLLSYENSNDKNGFQCRQLNYGIGRAKDVEQEFAEFAVWSGGLKVTSNAGEQYVSGADDFVESEVWLRSQYLGEKWFGQLNEEMNNLDKLSRVLWSAVVNYYQEMQYGKNQRADKANQATQDFWQLAEQDFQKLVKAIDLNDEKTQNQLRNRFQGYVRRLYNQFCPNETVRQLDAWARHRPKFRSQKSKSE